MFLRISNALALSYCSSWTHEDGVRRPNTVLGVICRQCFPGWVTLPGEGRVPELGMTWEHYLAAPAPPEHRVGDVECDTVADIVIATFWVISPLPFTLCFLL